MRYNVHTTDLRRVAGRLVSGQVRVSRSLGHQCFRAFYRGVLKLVPLIFGCRVLGRGGRVGHGGLDSSVNGWYNVINHHVGRGMASTTAANCSVQRGQLLVSLGDK